MKDSQLADALMADYRTAPVDPAMRRLLAFAENVALDASSIGPLEIERLRSAGFSDRAILDAAHVAGFFSYMNRVVQALGLDGRLAHGSQAVKARARLPENTLGSHAVSV